MIILDGREVAEVRRRQLKVRVERFQAQHGRGPGLGVILVGDDPASQVYVRNKIAACHEVGLLSQEKRLSASARREEVAEAIQHFNRDSQIDGILLQLPLPAHLNGPELIELIDPKKDPDGLTMANMGRLFAGQPRSISCTPFGVMKILEHYQIPLAGQHAVVVGRSNIVGKPMAHLLLQAHATVTVCHSRTRDLRAITTQGDIVVVAAGQPAFLGRDDFKKGAVVVDVGIHRQPSSSGKAKLIGDVNPVGFDGWIQALTPVPGGVGPMTITMLLENTVNLAEA